MEKELRQNITLSVPFPLCWKIDGGKDRKILEEIPLDFVQLRLEWRFTFQEDENSKPYLY